MFIVLMLPLDKSFHKVKCYSLTVTQASGTTASNVVPRKKIPRVQIRVVIKIYSFIHFISGNKQTNKQASKQIQQAITGRPIDRYRYRPTIDDDRPPTTDRRTDRPTIDDDRPTDDRRRPTDRRSTTTDRRRSPTTDRPPTIDDDRPPTIDRPIFFSSLTVDYR